MDIPNRKDKELWRKAERRVQVESKLPYIHWTDVRIEYYGIRAAYLRAALQSKADTRYERKLLEGND